MVEMESFLWEQGNKLSEDYRQDFSKVAGFYPYNPRDEQSLSERMKWLDSHREHRADREKLAVAVSAYNRKIGNTGEAIATAESLKEPETLVIVGGQQAGLFTGPLYVIHKAITLIQLAKQAERRLGRKVAPLFWIAGEDHDLEEVNHIYTLSGQQELEKIKIEQSDGKRTSISQLEWSAEAWNAVIGQLEKSLMDTEFKPDLIGKLRHIVAKSRTLVDFFGTMMAGLFGEYGLVLMNSDDPAIRALEAPMFVRLLENDQALGTAYQRCTRRLESLEYRAQVEPYPGSANLFIYHQGERRLLLEREDGYSDKQGEVFYTKAELLDIAHNHPERLSNNVLTRPLMQEFLFPVLQTVLGPGETAYWAQIGEAFKLLEMQMPPIIPRYEYTLIEGTIRKYMQKYNFTFDDAVVHFAEKKKAWLEQQDQLNLQQRFADVKQQFKQMYAPIVETAAEVNPGLRKLGDTNMQKIIEQIEFLESRTQSAFESQYEAALRQLERIRMTILPMDKPQERVYNVCVYLNKYGEKWLRELIEESVEPLGMHQIVYL